MIKNQRQYKIVKSQMTKCELALRRTVTSPNPNIPEAFRKAEIHALENELQKMKQEIKSYEEIRSGKEKKFIGTLASLAELLIKARQRRGLNQRELAQIVGCKEQQIQRYESGDYKQASFQTILQIAQALEVNSEIVFNIDGKITSEERV